MTAVPNLEERRTVGVRADDAVPAAQDAEPRRLVRRGRHHFEGPGQHFHTRFAQVVSLKSQTVDDAMIVAGLEYSRDAFIPGTRIPVPRNAGCLRGWQVAEVELVRRRQPTCLRIQFLCQLTEGSGLSPLMSAMTRNGQTSIPVRPARNSTSGEPADVSVTVGVHVVL